MSKPIFIKMELHGTCWFSPCTKKGIGTLNYSNGSEVRVCWDCARKRAKIRRIRKDKGKIRVLRKETILNNTSMGNLGERGF